MDSVNHWAWWVEAFSGICVVACLHVASKKVISLVMRKGGSKENLDDWRRRLDRIIHPPVALLLWSLAVIYFLDVVGQRFGFSIAVGYLASLRSAVVAGSLAWLAFRWKSEIQKSILARGSKKVDITTVQIVGRLSTIAIVVLTGLVVLQLFGLNTAPLLAFGSIGAASLGFAGKDVMANFCSGLMLYITRPFVLGDQVFLPEKHLEGIIEEIGWFKTLIRDKDKRAVYLPNNLFSTELLINVSRMTHRRILQTVQLPFEAAAKVPSLIEKIRKAVVEEPTVDHDLPLHVHLRSFGDHSLQVEIEAYSAQTGQSAFYDIEQKLLLRVQEILQEAEVEVAVPARRMIQAMRPTAV